MVSIEAVPVSNIRHRLRNAARLPAVADPRLARLVKPLPRDVPGKDAQAHQYVGGQLRRLIEMLSIPGVSHQPRRIAPQGEHLRREMMSHLVGKGRADRGLMMRRIY